MLLVLKLVESFQMNVLVEPKQPTKGLLLLVIKKLREGWLQFSWVLGFCLSLEKIKSGTCVGGVGRGTYGNDYKNAD